MLRWLGLVPLVLGLGLLVAGLVVSGHLPAVWLVLAGLVLFIVGGSTNLPGFGTAWQILLAIAATFLGVVDAVRGRTMQIWTPAASRN